VLRLSTTTDVRTACCVAAHMCCWCPARLMTADPEAVDVPNEQQMLPRWVLTHSLSFVTGAHINAP
jgi:hypothetical protein